MKGEKLKVHDFYNETKHIFGTPQPQDCGHRLKAYFQPSSAYKTHDLQLCL
jgi:hypothetical protein